MDNMTESEKDNRYGIAWKTDNKVEKEKIFDSQKTHKKCLLVANNGEKELNKISNILKEYNYEVDMTLYEENAFKIFKKRRYDLLIKVIPRMVGADLFVKIKTLVPKTEVMIVTGLELLKSCLETITSGALAPQKKPNKRQILDKNNIKDYIRNEFRLLAVMDFFLHRYSF